ncbi:MULTISPECIES: serine/threonine-protein kinase [unclassified Solwaraspora]|uniref:serine/threonine-protein kinase n=1 Tax=unclassified Solwaraspora TaxID=2627926 RepID=UPI00248C3FA6|nr:MULTISPECIES: serine/threonine-protein kinase [unclassified Solwaraspora]WBB96129.1 serine/threonine-protein kinase [Solwaraspora sp. WMMA2059]WBC19966.1 serine/threonine-protein kinase [Solwaraspora sp. WMMA2080]WJK32437.1 serine/threonine-protein kinase [Solwaraspora sp. WMMA2065]
MDGQDSTRQALDGRYRLGAEFSRGAVGAVHRGHDLHDDVPVAVKVLRSEAAEHPDLVEGFHTEAALLSRLNHPNVIRLRARTAVGDLPALVLDLVDGDDLRHRVRRDGPLPPAVAVAVAAQVATALSYLHERDIAHGDVKPANLLAPADGGRVRLIDFGAARAGHAAAPDQATLATPEYAAPEIACGGPPTWSSDVYALGIVLFELLCGRTPYRGGSADEVLARHRRCAPVPPAGLPPAVWPVIEQCLAARPADRPTARSLVARLRGLEPALDGWPALPALPADTVTWWPRDVPATAGAAVGARPRRRALQFGVLAGAGLALSAVVAGLTLAAGQGTGPQPGRLSGPIGPVGASVPPAAKSSPVSVSPGEPEGGASSGSSVGPTGQVGSSGMAGSGVAIGTPHPSDSGQPPGFTEDMPGELGLRIGDPVPQWPMSGVAGPDTPN